MTGQFVNHELLKNWDKAFMACSNYHPGICLEGLMKTTNKISLVRTADDFTDIRTGQSELKSSALSSQ
jgi:hypothetical protein